MLDLSQPQNAQIDERLRAEEIIWLGSVRPDGRPHLVPVWFLWDGSTFLIFSQPNQQKLRNVRSNPNVALALEGHTGGGGRVVIEGQAMLVDDPSLSVTSIQAYAEKYAQAIPRIGLTPERMAALYSESIRVTPTKFSLL